MAAAIAVAACLLVASWYRGCKVTDRLWKAFHEAQDENVRLRQALAGRLARDGLDVFEQWRIIDEIVGERGQESSERKKADKCTSSSPT